MSQRTSGLYRLVGLPMIYTLVQRMLAKPGAFKHIVETMVRPPSTGRILDLGCGPAHILPLLPPGCEYVGIDANPRHIETAQETHGTRGTFLCADFSAARDLGGEPFSMVTMFGLLHHLDDDAATAALQIARDLVDPVHGRVFALDPCRAPGQHWMARFLINRDSGQNVRTEEGYRNLASGVFDQVEITLRHDMLNLPYTHCITTCLAGNGAR
jgi:SAM-dependent methyltransferase